MKKKASLLSAVIAAILTLQILPGAGNPASAAKADSSHADAIYKTALPLLTSSEKLPQAIKYLNSHIYATGSYRATVLTLKLENLHKAGLQTWESKFSVSGVQRKLASIYKAETSMSKLAESTQDTSLRALLKGAGESGYKLETAEGYYFPVIDYGAYRKYKLYVTDDISDYITIMATETDLPPSKDNGLIISWTDVAARALAQEQFTQKYPGSNRISAVKSLYSMYVTNTFYGQNNTPLFHYDDLEMDLEAQKAYTGILAQKSGSSPFLQKLGSFMKLLKDKQYKLDDEVKAFLKKEVPLEPQ
ncbi:hypothetical protein J7E73_08150 [Paenibacillus albidus]|uniref:hypothetical protein n=1 Tax=Paenibacillus albidus TaxID=2041023 RepID=UPI001BEB497E|nr:hypothetical protein [Paenibacillus albidus]MBT2289104.1 hypothetical protein [Paenibacillus albidus]